MNNKILKVSTLVAALMVSGTAMAAYPEKPITLIVPFTVHGGTDVVTRAFVKEFEKEIGQKVVIKNVGGGGGRTGTEELLVAEPDGYTLLVSSVSTAVTNTLGDNKFQYDTVKDFTHIGNFAETPHILSVGKSFQVNNFKDFHDLMKKGEHYSYGSIGVASSQHMLMEYYKHLTGANIKHHPYRGGGQAVVDTAKGIVDMNLDQIQSSIAAIRSGDLKPLAISGTTRSKALPDVPTFKEVGMDAINYGTFYGISGPEGLDKDVVTKVNAALKRAATHQSMKDNFDNIGAVINVTSPEGFIDKLLKEKVIYKKMMDEAKISLK